MHQTLIFKKRLSHGESISIVVLDDFKFLIEYERYNSDPEYVSTDNLIDAIEIANRLGT